MQKVAEAGVIEADDGDVVRDAQTGCLKPAEDPEGDEIVDGDDGGEVERCDSLFDGVETSCGTGPGLVHDVDVDLSCAEAVHSVIEAELPLEM